MNWLSIMQLILASVDAELPIIAAIIAAAETASAPHVTLLNTAVSSALAAKSK
jgi:hypothetical protein